MLSLSIYTYIHMFVYTYKYTTVYVDEDFSTLETICSYLSRYYGQIYTDVS